jgi:prepilin-type N-terminal cleavage/methylation domain-containing protein
MKSEQRGFTLIELLVVIAIIGILASVVLVSLNASRNKAREVRILTGVRQMRTNLESAYFSGYADLLPNGLGDGVTQIASVNPTGPSFDSLLTLAKDISFQNGNGTIADLGSGSIDIFTNGSGLRVGPASGYTDTGLVIFTSNTAGSADDFAIYATTTAGYVCIDSLGHTVKAGEGTMIGPVVSAVPTENSKVVCH